MMCAGGHGVFSFLVHELRTPLISIVGNTELVLGGGAGGINGSVHAALVEVATAARRLEAVAAALSRLDLMVATPRLAPSPTDLDAACREAGIATVETRGLRRSIDVDGARLVAALRAAARWLRGGAATTPVQATIGGPLSDGTVHEAAPGNNVVEIFLDLPAGPSADDPDDLGGPDLLACRLLVDAEGGEVSLTRGGLLMRWAQTDKSGGAARGRGFSA